MKRHGLLALLATFLLSAIVATPDAEARNPYRRAFFNRYPGADGTQLSDLPSNAGHCGACHFDFDGGGARNPYGLSLEARLAGGLTIDQAIADVEFDDPDNDGYNTFTEVTDTVNWPNTPTFPGLSVGNYTSALNVALTDLYDPGNDVNFLKPAGSDDTTPPDVTILSPVGGESWDANTTQTVTWTATDASGIAKVEIYLSDDGGVTFKQIAGRLPNTGTFDQFIPNLPGTDIVFRVEAYDNAGNEGYDDSPAAFSINPVTYGVVPTTLRDFEMPGTQPFGGPILDDPSEVCIACHGNYDANVEHWHNWQGSMMGQAQRDPLFMATVAVAEQVVPAVGDLCLRCHTPGGWMEGRSLDTSGNMMVGKDLQGVQCDFCHRAVDPHYTAGVSPARDEDILNNLDAIPVDAANGQFVVDPDPIMRGPYADANASHQFLESDFHRRSDMCATCHDVSNPAFVAGGSPGKYDVQALDTPHPDGDKRNMFPVERTFSEWAASEYASTGVFAPQFAGGKPDGIVGTCQDCHMKDVTGVGCNQPGAPTRSDLGLHDLTGANTFVPAILAEFYPDVDQAALDDGILRARAMLTMAATMELTPTQVEGQPAINVRITNETGHKLPSGYPEGRRMWINVKAYDGADALVYESGAYDMVTGELGHDEDAKIYHIEPGISSRLSVILGMPAGPSFFFPLNDTVYSDNRIPPRGFTNAAFETAQSPPVDYTYADGQYWDDTTYLLPTSARRVDVAYYYQTTSKEYITFLRDENTTNTLGQELYDAWVAQGMNPPEAVAQESAILDVSAAPGEVLPRITTLGQNYPNPFNPQTRIEFTTTDRGPVSLKIYDGRGHLVRTLVDESRDEGRHQELWDGRDDGGRGVASGVYHYVLKTNQGQLQRKMTLVR